MESRVRLAVTLGDPRGIGPEVVAKALERRPDLASHILVVGRRDFAPMFGEFLPIDGPMDDDDRSAGLVSIAQIERAVQLALGGGVLGVVTGPVHKGALSRAGSPYPGHTEMLGALTGAPRVGMLMCREPYPAPDATVPGPSGALRVLLATTHVALADVPRLVTKDLLCDQTRLLGRALRDWWGIDQPRIALCALNPHASDGGLFGDEERLVYGPALDALAQEPWTTSGPIPADTVFHRALAGEFDAVVAPYHDVGMAAFKTATFGGGVNVTLGLPFVRTSPDHGTAFDIAGRGIADEGSTVQALALALALADRRARQKLKAATQSTHSALEVGRRCAET